MGVSILRLNVDVSQGIRSTQMVVRALLTLLMRRAEWGTQGSYYVKSIQISQAGVKDISFGTWGLRDEVNNIRGPSEGCQLLCQWPSVPDMV